MGISDPVELEGSSWLQNFRKQYLFWSNSGKSKKSQAWWLYNLINPFDYSCRLTILAGRSLRRSAVEFLSLVFATIANLGHIAQYFLNRLSPKLNHSTSIVTLLL